MKRIICIISAVLILAAVMTACGEKTISTGTTETAAAEDKAPATEKAAQSSGSVDVDLTQMSSTMIYSEVQNMMMAPNDYVGKTVKMNGAFSVTELNGKRYYACIIKDATACCAQGIEFKWAGDHSYPDDYPEDGAEITVTGKFSTYLEDKQTYCELQNADLQF